MKIFVLAGYADSLIKFRGPLLGALVKAGNEVVACAPENPENVMKQLHAIGVSFRSIPLQRTGMNPARDMYALYHLWSLMRRERPDIVFSYTIKPVIYGSWAARWAGVKQCYAMITGLGNTFDVAPGKKKWLHEVVCRLYRFGLKKNRAVFFQNPDDRDFFLKLNLIGKNTKAVLVNGSGLDLDHYAVVPPVKKPAVFLLIARIIREKGIEQYAEAAKRLKERYKDATFRLLGRFDDNPSAIREETVMEWHKQGIIEFLGPADDVRPFIASSSVYVLPSYYGEGTPRTVLEAMAMGKPVITTDAPGCRETVRVTDAGKKEGTNGSIRIGSNGILVPLKDVASLAEAMEHFLRHPEQIEVMGREGRAYAQERYDVHKVNAVLMKEMGLLHG